MARGYSASRSKSARPTLRLKRERSASLSALKGAQTKNKKNNNTNKEDENAEATAAVATTTPRSVKISKRKPSMGEMDRSRSESKATRRARSTSLLRQRIEEMEATLQEEDEAQSEDEEETIADREVLTKYQLLGKAVDSVLLLLESLCVAGANTAVLCQRGDEELLQHLRGMYSKQKDPKTGRRLPKGLSYPTNVSVNEVLCNNVPLTPEEGVVLQGNDVVKLHLGAFLDGYPVTAARTVIVPCEQASTAPSSRTPVDLTRELLCAYEAGRVALLAACRSLQPQTDTADITDTIAAVGQSYQTEALEGVLSHRVKRWVPDGSECFINRRVTMADPQQDVASAVVRPSQVWTVDVAFTNNGCQYLEDEAEAEAKRGGYQKQKLYHTTTVGDEAHIFRRVPDGGAAPATRVPFVAQVLQLVDDFYFCFPFHYRQFDARYVMDPSFTRRTEAQPRQPAMTPLRAKLGLQQLIGQGQMEKYPVLRVQRQAQEAYPDTSEAPRQQKRKDIVTVRFSATVAVLPKKIIILCGAPPTSLPSHVQQRGLHSASIEEEGEETNGPAVLLPPTPEDLFNTDFLHHYVKPTQNNVYELSAAPTKSKGSLSTSKIPQKKDKDGDVASPPMKKRKTEGAKKK